MLLVMRGLGSGAALNVWPAPSSGVVMSCARRVLGRLNFRSAGSSGLSSVGEVALDLLFLLLEPGASCCWTLSSALQARDSSGVSASGVSAIRLWRRVFISVDLVSPNVLPDPAWFSGSSSLRCHGRRSRNCAPPVEGARCRRWASRYSARDSSSSDGKSRSIFSRSQTTCLTRAHGDELS